MFATQCRLLNAFEKVFSSLEECASSNERSKLHKKISFNFGRNNFFVMLAAFLARNPCKRNAHQGGLLLAEGVCHRHGWLGYLRLWLNLRLHVMAKKRTSTVLMKFRRYSGQPQRQSEPAVSLASWRGLWRIHSSDSSYAIHVKNTRREDYKTAAILYVHMNS